jgi:tetratricopeptide (TPR) repeat protein
MTRRTTTLLAALLLVIFGAAAYFGSLRAPFIFDDMDAIPGNPTIRSLSSVEVLIPPGGVTLSRRPLANLSFAVNYAIGKVSVRSYHIGNLLIHLLAALTLFGIVRRTLLLPALRDRFGGVSTALAAAVTLMWALHPLQTESVTYVVQRVESLMGLFYLLTLYAVIRGATSEQPKPWYVASVVACALGMGAKEVMVTAPVVLLLYDRAFLSGSFREAFRRRGKLYLGLAATWVLLGLMMLLYKPPGLTGFGFAVGPWEYARTQPGVILHYLRLSFWPRPLCLDYSWPIAKSLWQDLPAVIVIAALLAVTLWALRRAPMLGFFGAWFFLILAPSSSVVPIIKEVAAEHRMYLPLAAPAAAAVVAVWLIADRLTRRASETPGAPNRAALGITLLLALCAAAALGISTSRRNAQYQDALSIWEDTVAQRPRNPDAWCNLSWAYVNASRNDEAIRAAAEALALEPRLSLAWNNRGLALTALGRPAEAISDYDEAISHNPDFVEAFNNRGMAYALGNRFDEALRDYNEALRLKPDFAEALVNRGNIYARLGRLNEAMADYDRAIALKEDFPEAYFHRAFAESLSPRSLPEAISDYSRAIALKPGYADAYFYRAGASAQAGRWDEAIRDCTRRLALDPDFAPAYNNRAMLYYRTQDYDKAAADLRKFIQLGGRPAPEFLRALEQAIGQAKPTRP